MPKIALAKTILIDAPASQVYNVVSDLSKWTQWSPWLLMEPEAKVEVAEDKQSYSWEGKRTGTGNMKITATEANKSVDFDLTFLTPWKSFAKVGFALAEKDGKTEATWSMDSSLPWFMFWMKNMMIAFVGMDYERGLRLLKDYSEDGKTHSSLDFKGSYDAAGFKYVGIKSTKSFDEMGKSMSEDFPRIISFLSDNKIEPGLAFTQYHKWEVVKGLATYTSGVQVDTIPEGLPEGMISGEIPSAKVHTIRHTGPYHHLGNAWSTLYTMQRGKEFKLNKAVDPFEVYMNSPMEVAPNELITEIHFPVK